VNSFLNLRVADVWACYKQWRDKGAFFPTEPLDNHGWGLPVIQPASGISLPKRMPRV
jgi:hypothetical protein